MSPTHEGPPSEASQADEDPRLAEAVEEYRAALRSGRRPDREALLARHPDLAEALAGCLDTLEFVDAAAEDLDACLAALRFIGRAAHGPRSVAAAVAESQPPEQAPGQLGDFRLLREVGRGGMGVVY